MHSRDSHSNGKYFVFIMTKFSKATLTNVYLFKVSDRNARKKCVEYVQSWQSRHQKDANDVVVVSL